MKQIILSLILLVSLNSFAADTVYVDQPNTNVQEVERVVDKYSEKVMHSFSELMEDAAPAAKEGFSWVVKLQKAKAIGLIFLSLIALGILLVGFKMYNSNHSYSEDLEIFAGVMLVVGSIGFFVSLVGLYHAILFLIAPEWYALKEIIDLIK